jgi:hypothetical protein
MCDNSTVRTQTFLSAGDAAVLQEVAKVRISIQSACALNTRYKLMKYLNGSNLSSSKAKILVSGCKHFAKAKVQATKK